MLGVVLTDVALPKADFQRCFYEGNIRVNIWCKGTVLVKLK